ncbi:MAG TPA: glutathione S-transferase family protein [Burkholderiales bacterium]|nr:glutathione S-transferase family protein [Burkholderiales bacterium]
MLKIHGVPFSAHTRKVIITALEKGVSYQLMPVVPLAPPSGWDELSPLGLIPVIQDGDTTLADSSVIALYLERRYPEHAFYPSDPASFGRTLWIEEFVDGGLAVHVLRGVLMQKVFAPKFLNRAPDHALIEKSVNELIPPKLAYLEKSLSGDWFAGKSFTIGDVAVASMLLNYHYAGLELDEGHYPRLRAFLERALKRASFRRAFEAEIPAAVQVGGLDLSLLRRLGY